MTYTLPTLSYDYKALEPFFDAETMEIHHKRHHQAYIDNLNKAVVGTAAENADLMDTLRHISAYSPAIRNNAGGHFNHDLFWKTLSPSPQLVPNGVLAAQIKQTFGDLDALKALIKQTGLGQFGSGWVWLFVKYNGTLAVASNANQDNPLMDTNLTNQGFPILGIDVWEHAYYLKYQNKRADFIDAFWSVLDWAAVEANYQAALKAIG